MANLVKAYHTYKDIPKNKEFVPGDIIVYKQQNNNFFLEKEIIEKLYIVNLDRQPIYVTRNCLICNKFHINKIQYINCLGKHWKKYREKYYYNLGLPFTGSQCYPLTI